MPRQARGLRGTGSGGTWLTGHWRRLAGPWPGGAVKTHVNRIFAKTGSRDRAHAVSYAYTHGYADPPGGSR